MKWPLLIVAGLAACGERTGPESMIASVEAARARWAARGPAAYTMIVSRSCECLPEMSGPVAIEVRGGVLSSRTYTRTGKPVGATYAAVFPDVPGLFQLIEDAGRRGAFWVEVIYDPALGFPRRIVTDEDGTWGNDDEVVYSVGAFEPR